jgi:hypothetical protein
MSVFYFKPAEHVAGRAACVWSGQGHRTSPPPPAACRSRTRDRHRRHRAQEQEKGVSGLVQTTVAQIVCRQGAARQVLGAGASVCRLGEPALGEASVARKTWAGWKRPQCPVNVLKVHAAMFVHVAPGNGVRHALIAQDLHEPDEQRRGVPTGDRLRDPDFPKTILQVSERARRQRGPAYFSDVVDGLFHTARLPARQYSASTVSDGHEGQALVIPESPKLKTVSRVRIPVASDSRISSNILRRLANAQKTQ